MKSAIKNILFALCALPLLAKMPYMVSVWKSSPLEGGDFIVWLAIPAVAALCEIIRCKAGIEGGAETYKKWMLTALAACLAAWFLIAFKINAAGILLGIFILALAVDLRFGRAVFVSQIPTFMFAIVAVPSISYWLDYYLHIGLAGTYSYFAFKFLFATGFLAAWSVLSVKKRRYPRIWSIIFCMAVCAAALYNRIEYNSLPAGDPIFVDTQKNASGEWMSREDPVSEADARFFTGCDEIVRKSYFNADSGMQLLALSVNRISSIHPVGICLESSGYDIVSSRQVSISLSDREIQINELRVRKNGSDLAVYSWFSDGEKSTGDFTKFRLQKSAAKNWRHYQIMTPEDGAKEDRFRSFLEAFKN